MNKLGIKTRISKRQNGKCALTEELLPSGLSLMDTDRIYPKAKGGIYTDQNTRIVDPVAHMKRHGNFRERTDEINQLKILIDAREQMRKFVNSSNNRILAMKRRTDGMDESTKEWLGVELESANKELGKLDRRITKHLKSMSMPIIKSALGIKGIGPITVAYLISYIDINKAEHASSLWAYVGYDKPSHERYTKNVAGGGNKTLRTVLYTTADSMIKTRSVYREVYDREKERLSASEKLVMSRNTEGKLNEIMWKDTKLCHRHGAAIRKMMKHFLADLWFVWRELEGLSTRPLYVEEILGHTGIIRPAERGWKLLK
jgi:hypothetical protein